MNVRSNKHLLLWSSVSTVVLLGTAAYRENVQQEWRRLQREYGERAVLAGGERFDVKLRQIVVPVLDVSDRCVTCHLGMSPGISAIEGHPVFGSHPDVVHDVSEYGCTTCHSGQGRATESAAAHGTVPHWPEPMLPLESSYAGCGVCHTHLDVPSVDLLERGTALIERHDCLACHRLDGRGGTLRPGGAGGMEGPDLSRVGGTGYDPGWYEAHLREMGRGGSAWTASFGPLPDSERRQIETMLSTRVGASKLVESKALFHSLGCRGCHTVGGIGGDDGPDLSHVGDRDPAQLDFTQVPGPHTVAAWLAEHFRAPARVVPGSQMPELGLTEPEIEALTFYMLSLRQGEFPGTYWPDDRLSSERFGRREFANDGATLYGTFCAACHGVEGQGMRYAGMPAFPAIAHPDFLALASDEFIAATIRAGRRGRRMPAWGQSSGGLREEEIDAVVAHIRILGAVRQEADERPRRWVRGKPDQGARLFEHHCASCHGTDGKGNEGPSLADPVFLNHATDFYLFESIRRGRRGTSMPGFGTPSVSRPTLSSQEIESIVAFIRTWEVPQ